MKQEKRAVMRDLVKRLCEELEIDAPHEDSKEKALELSLTEETLLRFKELDPGVSLQAEIALCPEKRREELFILLMRANFLGQGTGGARIGLDPQEKYLTLSLGLPYELEYASFKQHVEDFVNYLLYWRAKMAEFELQQPVM